LGYTETEPIQFARSIQKPTISLHERAFFLDYWSEEGREKEDILQGMIDFLMPRKYFITIDQGWNDWDLKISRGVWSRAHVKVCSENHGGNKRCMRIRCSLRLSKPAVLALSGYLLLAASGLVFGLPELVVAAAAAGTVNAAYILNQKFRLGRILYHVSEIVAKKVGLTPINA
jgi:hypothetical protein